MIRRLLPDPFILWLLLAVTLASLLPVSGPAARAVDAFTLAAIFALFFLHGARLPREALVASLTDWRLHAAILSVTFLLFPLLGVTLSRAFPGLLPPELWAGILFLCALPSTVQSSIAFTAMARGNVAGAVTAATLSNLAGVFLTPFLVALLLEAQGAAVSASAIGRIVLLLLFPFLLGHLLRARIFPRIVARPWLTGAVDKGTILLAVYGAFSAAMIGGIWTRLPPAALILVAGLCVGLLLLALASGLLIARLGGFSPESRATILFCGSVKSLATGVPMARILFPGPMSGLVILPVMIFHTAQLILCAMLAVEMGRQASGGASREQRRPKSRS